MLFIFRISHFFMGRFHFSLICLFIYFFLISFNLLNVYFFNILNVFIIAALKSLVNPTSGFVWSLFLLSALPPPFYELYFLFANIVNFGWKPNIINTMTQYLWIMSYFFWIFAIVFVVVIVCSSLARTSCHKILSQLSYADTDIPALFSWVPVTSFSTWSSADLLHASAVLLSAKHLGRDYTPI